LFIHIANLVFCRIFQDMKIAYFVNAFPVLSESFIQNQIIGMIERGHDVNIYANIHLNAQCMHSEVEKYKLIELTHFFRVPRKYTTRLLKAIPLIVSNRGNIRVSTIARSINVFKYGREALSLNLFYNAMSMFRKKHYDILHCQFGPLGVKVLHLKQIGAISGTLVTSFRGYDITNYLLKKPGIYNQLYREGDLFLPVSQRLKQLIVEDGCEEKKIIVHHSGIDCTKFMYFERNRSECEPTKVLTIARLIEKKGIEYALQAVANVISSGRPIKYTIVGDGPLQLNLEIMARDLGIAEHVNWVGSANHDAIISFLQDAHIFLSPSVTASNGDQEGIPNAIKEAMATGLPVLTTIHGGIPELVKDGITGFLVPERDVDALAERLGYLIDREEQWQGMGTSGRMHVYKNYEINTLNDRLENIYENSSANYNIVPI